MANAESSTVKELNKEELDALLDINPSGTVLTPTEKEHNVFTNSVMKEEQILTEVLSEEEIAAQKAAKEKEAAGEEILESLEEEPAGGEGEEGPEKGQGTGEDSEEGNKGKAKGGITAKAISNLVKEGFLLPFEGDTPIEEYSDKDIVELIKVNFTKNKEEAREEVTKEFFESISPDLQHLAKFEMDGGQDLKGEMRKLLSTLEVRDLDPSNESDQDKIIEQWLTMTNWGTPEEIKQEVLDIRDRNKSEERAKQYKPKIDAKNAEVLSKEAAKVEALKKKRIEATQKYSESIYNTLVKGELGGIKLTKKNQDMIFNGLTETQYPSITGKPTTKLGHLLEKYQVLDPDYAKIAKVMWLLEDEAGYEEALKNKGSVDATEKVVKKLKEVESEKTGAAESGGSGSDDAGKGRRTLPRAKKSLFDRQ